MGLEFAEEVRPGASARSAAFVLAVAVANGLPGHGSGELQHVSPLETLTVRTALVCIEDTYSVHGGAPRI
jgi:hypothetical protein